MDVSPVAFWLPVGFCLNSGVPTAEVVLQLSLPDVPGGRCLLTGVVIMGLAAGALDVEALVVWFGKGCPRTLVLVSVLQEAAVEVLGSATNPIFFTFLHLFSLTSIARPALLGVELS